MCPFCICDGAVFYFRACYLRLCYLATPFPMCMAVWVLPVPPSIPGCCPSCQALRALPMLPGTSGICLALRLPRSLFATSYAWTRLDSIYIHEGIRRSGIALPKLPGCGGKCRPFCQRHCDILPPGVLSTMSHCPGCSGPVRDTGIRWLCVAKLSDVSPLVARG